MGAMASQINSLTIVHSTVCTGADQRKHQPFIQAHIKENIKAPRHWPLCGEFPAQIASNAENVFIWWRHHDDIGMGWFYGGNQAGNQEHLW